MANQQKCKHAQCHCTGSEVQKNGYCSDSCQQGKMQGGKCGCGHKACR